MLQSEKLKRQWEKQDEDEINAAIDALLLHKHGRRLVWWLLEIGRMGQQPFTQNSLMTAFNCGELNVGQRILDRLLSVSPDGYVNLLKEMNDERNERYRELDAAIDIERGRDSYSTADIERDTD